MDMNSLAHTKWECKYHIVFAPKFRRKIIYKKIRTDIGYILRQLCERKGIEIIEAETCAVKKTTAGVEYSRSSCSSRLVFSGYCS